MHVLWFPFQEENQIVFEETTSVFVDSGDAKKFLKLKFNFLWKKQELFFKSISKHDFFFSLSWFSLENSY